MNVIEFIRESNKIEGIEREPTACEIKEFKRFMKLKKITIPELIKFVDVYQPNAKIRCTRGMDVMVGGHRPPSGGEQIVIALKELLDSVPNCTPYEIHTRFEWLHPFTDCNGRCGRMIWVWMMREAPLGFLHTFYYQALEANHSHLGSSFDDFMENETLESIPKRFEVSSWY